MRLKLSLNEASIDYGIQKFKVKMEVFEFAGYFDLPSVFPMPEGGGYKTGGG